MWELNSLKSWILQKTAYSKVVEENLTESLFTELREGLRNPRELVTLPETKSSRKLFPTLHRRHGREQCYWDWQDL